MNTKSLITAALSLSILAACGESFNGLPEQGQRQFASEEEEPQVTTPTPQVPMGTDFRSLVQAASFTAGESLSASTLPTDDTNYTLVLPTYLNETGWKAIAVADDGSVFFSFNAMASSQNQAEANRRALEGCYVRSVAKDCAIFAEGNYTKFSSSELFAQMSASTLPVLGDDFNSAQIPWVTMSSKNSLSSYSGFQSFKALALNVEGKGCFRNGAASLQEASRRAQQCCEWQSKGLACIVYALEDQVVFDIRKHIYPPKVSFALAGANFDPAQTPLVSEATRKHLNAQYGQIVAASNQPVALAINENGDWAYRSGASRSAARAAAIQACNAINGSSTCLVYAINNKVALSLEELEAL